jgi:hypothetical protein
MLMTHFETSQCRIGRIFAWRAGPRRLYGLFLSVQSNSDNFRNLVGLVFIPERLELISQLGQIWFNERVIPYIISLYCMMYRDDRGDREYNFEFLVTITSLCTADALHGQQCVSIIFKTCIHPVIRRVANYWCGCRDSQYPLSCRNSATAPHNLETNTLWWPPFIPFTLRRPGQVSTRRRRIEEDVKTVTWTGQGVDNLIFPLPFFRITK